MANRKYYAVKSGRKTGIYKTWEEAKLQVKGFSGAKYKSFATMDEANEYLSSSEKQDISKKRSTQEINKILSEEIEMLKEDEVIAFVDGSYTNEGGGRYSFGAVLLTQEKQYNLYKAFSDSRYADARNVAGEIEGVKQSISWAIRQGKKKIRIYYDYKGIECWATGEWKANIELTREYKRFFEEKSSLIEVSFCHTKAHTGITYNEMADRLAKRALEEE